MLKRFASLLMLATAFVTACSSSSAGAPAAPRYTLLPSMPTTATSCVEPSDGTFRTCAGWGDPGQIVVVVVGSSSCPNVATAATLTGPQAASITMTPQGGPSCTADGVETPSAIGAPAGLDASRPVTLTIDRATITLPPR